MKLRHAEEVTPRGSANIADKIAQYAQRSSLQDTRFELELRDTLANDIIGAMPCALYANLLRSSRTHCYTLRYYTLQHT
jgi:type III secretion system FlhB-like substrate exporter